MDKPAIIYEDEHLIAINKPSGVLSIPDRMQSQSSLKDMLIHSHGQIFTVHRLDKETSGVIVFAKDEVTHKFLSQQFEHRETIKWYTGLVLGTFIEKKGEIDVPITEHSYKKGTMMVSGKGKPSVTEYEVMEEFGSFSYLKFNLLTGRTHQIRVHMKHAGHPIACDNIYGDGKPVFLSGLKKKFKLSQLQDEERPILNRMALHAHQLILRTRDGTELILEADLPKELRAFLQQLRKWKKR
ncbi:MAG: RluA family pseudouridine synthase [Chitinophagaceae bacterium]